MRYRYFHSLCPLCGERCVIRVRRAHRGLYEIMCYGECRRFAIRRERKVRAHRAL